MSYTYSFFDNQLIGVDELNKITSRFVTGGVAREPSSVADINGFVADIATKGVVGDTSNELKVTLESGKIKINTGTAFFDNGTVVEVTEPELLDYTQGTEINVYFKSDINNNSIYPVCSESYPESDENIVHLAHISASGTVTDRREYARGKCAYYYSSHGKAVQLNVTFTPEEITTRTPKVIDVGSSDFTFMNVFGNHNGFSNYSTVNMNVYFDEEGNTKSSFGVIWGDSFKGTLADNPCWALCNRVHTASGDNYQLALYVDAKISDGKLILTPRDNSVCENIYAVFKIVLA